MNDQRNITKPAKTVAGKPKKNPDSPPPSQEIGGRKGPEPTRYGDWENNGVASDF